ncbi:prenyltransferase/squalene oxidase repeat-containing protein [Streptomyces vinaceus]|uniref:prenyltransferase/squalene oxidase repeat-containing protein n=1 Tax=Streptomyces vinaceus TaxID=1960 RepID=UPI0036958C51
MSPSVYETARLVALAPWLGGDAARIDFLMAAQEPDGSWGGTRGAYSWVPTLSAVDALLRATDRGGPSATRAATAGLRYLTTSAPLGPLPDTVAAELLVPALCESIEQRLNTPVPVPDVNDPALHRRIAERARTLGALPAKHLHSYEAIAPHCPPIQPPCGLNPGSLVGGSPAATAAWITATGGPSRNPRLVQHLETATAEHNGGPVSCPTPITGFEYLWVHYIQETIGRLHAREQTAAEIITLLTPEGVSGGPGLVPDADDTSIAIYLLSQLGHPTNPQTLHSFETPTHYACYPGESTSSPTANAHVLEALGSSMPHDLPARSKVSDWLAARQHPDGSWTDKWHASPYYAVYCCAPALHKYGAGPAAQAAVHRATAWLHTTRRTDGSWGHWAATAEETAYAILTLTRCGAAPPQNTAEVLERLDTRERATAPPPLWHDKDLYCPVRVVRAAIDAAREVARRPCG